MTILLRIFLRLFLSVSYCLIAMPLYAADSLDQIVVVVNDSVITKNQVEERLEMARQQATQHNTSSRLSDASLRKMVVEELIKQSWNCKWLNKQGGKYQKQI